MQISRITIEKLFGDLDYHIPLKVSEVATIIYAPNGYGKTTILEIIQAIFHLDLAVLSRHVFSRAVVEFADECCLEILREVAPPSEKQARLNLATGAAFEEPELAPLIFKIAYYNTDRRVVHSQQIPFDPQRMESNIPWVVSSHMPPGALERMRMERLRVERVAARRMRFVHEREIHEPRFAEWLRVLIEKHHTALVKTKRLDAELVAEEDERHRSMASEGPHLLPSVVKHSREMAGAIQNVLNEFSNLSQKLDRQFPRRLMKALATAPTSPSDTEAGLKALDEKYRRIVDAGILEKETIEPLAFEGPPSIITEKVMALYVQDQEEKLKVFDALLTKIETLRDLINSRFQRKQLCINRKTGYEIVSLTRDEPIPIDRLSSGEQHELVLFHRLLFNMRPDALVMIDEPEISLHVAWQEEFLRDLARISTDSGVHFLIATHSPQIISDRFDLAVDLAALAGS